MKLSIIVKKHATKDGREFYGATARGKFLSEVKGITEKEADEMFAVKMVACSSTLPASEGIYSLTAENGEAWIDRREGVVCGKLRVVRVKGSFTFEKKADLKDGPKAEPSKNDVAF